MRGRTPSRELEVTSLEGCYITELPTTRQMFVLLILFDNRIFWGPFDGIFEGNWSKCEIKYQLFSPTVFFPSPPLPETQFYGFGVILTTQMVRLVKVGLRRVLLVSLQEIYV